MKYLSLLTFVVFAHFCALSLHANIEFLFDGNGNTGETTVVSTLSGTVSSGNLVYDGTNSPSSGTIDLESALTSGQYILEVVLSAHDLSGYDTVHGSSSNTRFLPFEYKTGFSLSDGTNAAEVGLKSEWYVAAPYASIPILYSEGSGGTSKSINQNGITEGGNPTASSLHSDLTMGVSPITLQINADLNAGTWTSRVKYGSGDWVDLTQDGSGLTSISQIAIASSNTLWPWDGSSVSVDSITLNEVVAQSTSDISIAGTAWGANSDPSVTATSADGLIGDTDQILEDDGNDLTLQIIADLDSGDWASRYQIGSADWVALVTDGTGITDLSRFALKTETGESEAWGDSTVEAPNTGDYIKIDSIRILPGSNFVKNEASVDVGLVSSALLAFEFNGNAGEDLKAAADGSTIATASTGIVTGEFNFSGHLTDGSNLNIGYAGENSWTSQINQSQSFRTFTFDAPLTKELAGSDIVVFEVVIPNYDLSKSWDSTNTVGSLSNKGLQVSLRNSNNAGAAINLFTHNQIAPNSVLQIDFDDAAGTSLPELSIISALNYTGSWEFGGPQTDGEGNLNIGYSGLNRWADIYGSDDSGSVYRTFVIDADPDQANNQAIESGRYIFETRIDSADLSGSWKSGDHLVSNKGMQIILRKSDNSGAVLNFYSHLGNEGYQIKAQSNTWVGAGTTSSSGFTQAFGLSSDGAIDLQIRVNLDTGQWTTHAKSTSSSTWKDMELNGEGLTDIASIQIGVKTPKNDNDNTLYVWGDDTLNGNAPEDYVDANDDGIFNAGVASQSASSSELFSDSGDSSYPYAYTVVEPVVVELPQDASMSVSKSSNGNSMQFTWSGSGVTVESSEDLETWTPVSNPSSQILESLGLVSAKFYRLTMATSGGESSTSEQNIVIDVSELPDGGANYRIITSDANGNNAVQSNPLPLALGENTITVPSSSAERNVLLWMDGDVTFTSLNKNSEAVFTAIPGETFTDTNGNGVRDPGNAPLLGDYIKINYLRITQDTSADTNNSIAVSGKFTGGDSSVLGGTEVNSVLESSASQSGSILMKIDANLNTGAWTSAYSVDSGSTWNNLVTDGTGLTSITNLTFGVLHPEYSAWGDGSIAGGVAGDYIKVDSIILNDSTTNEDLVAFNFDDTTGTRINAAGVLNSGSSTGAWNFGGPAIQNGNLNIGYTEHWKWTGITSSPYRKYILDSAITAKEVSLVVSIADYNLSRSWDDNYEYNINSLSDKGILFRLDANNTDGATVELVTNNEANDLLLAQDMDGDGEPDFADSHPEDPFNGVIPTGVYVNNQFNDANGTQIRDTVDNGSYAPTTDGADAGTLVDSWTGANDDVRVINGALGWGYPGSYTDSGTGASVSANWADSNTPSKFRTKVLISDITSGIAVYETVISGYDLSRSWDAANSSQFQKGWRMIIKNGASSTDRQGAAINLYVTSDNDVMVEGQSWYTSDAVVLSTGNVRSKLNDADQADNAGLTLQIVVDTDTGYWYSRYKKNDSSTWTTLTVGSGFTKIDNIQITHKTPTGDAWGDANTTIGDYVLIDAITIKDSSENSVPTPGAPQDLTDSDGDGVYDFADQFPNDVNNQYDWDGDTVGNGSDANDEDPTVQ
ncbi:MAG: hypothetical protein ACJZ8T_01300 [Coraliomargaritaceae bacterium]